MAHDVFISYSHKNGTVADAICHELEAGGIRCWYAPRNIEYGESWSGAIMKALRSSKVFVLVFSGDSNASPNVLNEVTNAANFGCIIVPFRIDESEMSDEMAYYLTSRHWMDAITPPLKEHILVLRKQIQEMLGTKPGRDVDQDSGRTVPVAGTEDGDGWRRYDLQQEGLSLLLPAAFQTFTCTMSREDLSAAGFDADAVVKGLKDTGLALDATDAGGARVTVKVKKGLYSAWTADEAVPELHPDTPVSPDTEEGRLGKRKFMRTRGCVGDVQEEQLFYLSYATLTRFHTIWINIYRYGGLTDSDRLLIHEIAKRADIRS